MFKRYKKKKEDPIAKRLKEPTPRLEEVARKRRIPFTPPLTLSERHAKWATEQEQAHYETIDFIDDTNEKVQEFIKYLGYEPDTLSKAVIVVETGKCLTINVEGYAVKQRSKGSEWKVK